jgi:hypothetical protein
MPSPGPPSSTADPKRISAAVSDVCVIWAPNRNRDERSGQQGREKGCIPLLFVNYIRTAPEFGTNTFEIGTFARKFVFRAATEEHAKQWLLGMHCSIAQVSTFFLPFPRRWYRCNGGDWYQ